MIKMDEIILFINSINKIAFLLLIITFIFLIWEINQLIKEKKQKKTPTIPNFNINHNTKLSDDVFKQNFGNLNVKKNKKDEIFTNSKANPFFLIVSGVILIIMIFYTWFLKEQKIKTSTSAKSSIINFVSSKGIVIFDENWREIKEQNLNYGDNNKKIYIGIKTIPGVKIDKARIRINRTEWLKEDETTAFDKINQVFYKEYKIATEEKKLIIEAQLHSLEDGWLTE